MGKIKILAAAFLSAATAAVAQTTPTFSQIIVFGDSLSDDGNVAQRVYDTFGFRYPSSNPLFNYSDYRFTNSNQTDPSGTAFDGVWHEQLAKDFLNVAKATYSLGGGTDYAFGGATTKDGTQERTVINNPLPFSGGDYSITIDNVGKQVNDYLRSHTPNASALYIIWGGGNDLFDDYSGTNVAATATRVGNLIQRLANAGARNFLVPNVPPLGAVPNSFGDANRVAGLDLASANYRARLSSVIATTKSMLAANGITIQVYALDVWLNTLRLLGEPAKYGFTNTTDPAQGESVNPDEYLFWDDIHPTTAGHHEIANEAFRLLSGQIAPLAKAQNISTRGLVGTGDNVLIAGFIIAGSSPKTVIIRAIGPSLSGFGISGALADPTLTLYNSNHVVLAANDNWKQTQQSEIIASGHAPLNDSESAIVATLNPGSYTAVVKGANGSTGIALAEVYDLQPGSNSVLRNLSTRGFVGTGDNVLIGGVSVGSGEPALVVLRAIGPSLSAFNIAQPLLDPTLQLFNANGMRISGDNDWRDHVPTAVKAALLAPGDDRESVIVASLAAGNYTAVVQGKNGTVGVALVEAYRIQ